MTQEVGVALSNPGVEPSVMAFQMPQSVVPDQGSTVSLWLILALAALGFYVLYGVIYLIVRSYFPDRVDLFPFVPWPNAAPIVVIKLPTLAPEPPPPPLPRRTLVQHGGTVNYPVSSSQGVLLLEAIAGPLKGDRIKVDRTNFQVGAGTNNDLRIDSDTYLSGSHALFQMSSGQWQVLDQDSRNGTFLDGKKVAVGRGHALRDGQVLRMGVSEFRVVLGDASETDTVAQPREHAELVDAAVYCPLRVAKASVFLIQVYLYPPVEGARVDQQARQADATSERRGTYSLPIDLPRGTRVDLHLEMAPLTVEEPDAVLVWRGTATAAQFEVAVPADATLANAIGRVRFAIGGVPAGTLRFQVAVIGAVALTSPAQPCEIQGVRYRYAFVSYSSTDRAEVLRRVQAFKIAGMSVFQDILHLDPGEGWERTLYREIDRCDVFLLFWSRAAAASDRVLREIDYALTRKGGDADRPPAIQPVPIEGPPIAPPPPQLRHLHFNDALLAHIRAASRGSGRNSG